MICALATPPNWYTWLWDTSAADRARCTDPASARAFVHRPQFVRLVVDRQEPLGQARGHGQRETLLRLAARGHARRQIRFRQVGQRQVQFHADAPGVRLRRTAIRIRLRAQKELSKHWHLEPTFKRTI